MGFSITTLAQKARTQTLIADSDLNLGNYDLIATDVKGDTAEFDEFVGGVGNFSNVLGSGNLDIEGTGNIKGLATFQNAVQVNGSLHVEGSINNVNIADNGEITTSQGVNGADFNGAKITSTKFNGASITSKAFNNVTLCTGTLTVTPASGTVILPSHIELSTSSLYHGGLTLLPYMPDVSYAGSIKFRGSTQDSHVIVFTSEVSMGTQILVNTSADYTYTFDNIRYLYAYTPSVNAPVSFYNFTIT